MIRLGGHAFHAIFPVPDSAIIYVCKCLPVKGGGGAGVAYNYLAGSHGRPMEPSEADHILLAGMAEARLPTNGETLDSFLATLEIGTKSRVMLFASQGFRILGIARHYKRVIVLAFTPYYLWPLLQIGGRRRITCVHSEHSKGGRHYELAEERCRFGWRERFVRWCVRFNFTRPDRIVFPSRGALGLFTEQNPGLRKHAEEKSAILYNGVAMCDGPPPRPMQGTLRIVSVAHHVREKGLDNLLQSLRLASDAGVDWKFLNYGQKTDLTEGLLAKARATGISDRIEFAGLKPQAKVRASLGEADVFLHSPVVVVFDLSLLEAMMHSLPIVIPPLEGNREALGEDYELFASSPEEAAARLTWIAAHREEASRIGRRLRARAIERFTNEAMVGNYAALLRDLLVRSV